jgi:hypothetical protein
MNEAKTTWALVVGIDEYDLPGLRRLTGAAADAAAAARWLRSLGVPDAQILLHAAPAAANVEALAELGLPYHAAREPDLWRSIAALRKVTGGTRLFVFLSGHGLYEPASRRLFLTQEAGVDDAWTNLGMDEYLELFRSMGFARQFLFLDGCQNYPYTEVDRSTIKAAMHAGVTGYTARPENTIVACYAAGQDQRALEVDGRGLFLRHLLAGLALDDPLADAVDLDFATGARTIDLRKLLYGCGGAVEREARRQSPPLDQTPQLEVRGRGQSDSVSPIARLPDLPSAAVRVEVAPPEAQADLARLRIFLDDPPQWDLRLPRPGDAIPLPLENRLPLGARGTAQCHVRPQAAWDLVNGQQTFRVAGDQVLVFEMTQRPGATLGAARMGYPVAGGARKGYDAGETRSRGGSLRGRDRDAETAAARHEAGPSLRLTLPRGGARALAGVLAPYTKVWFGAPADAPADPVWRNGVYARPTLEQVEEGISWPVEEGPLAVRVDLPWGSWSRTVRAPADGEIAVELPVRVGEPPLRVALHAALGGRGTAVLGVGGPAPLGRQWAGLFARSSAPAGADAARGAARALAPRSGRTPRAGSIAELRNGAACFPLLRGRALAVDLSRGGLRVEPLSAVPAPAWDLLVAMGRLDALRPDEAVELTRRKWDDWLLGLAGAYAIYAIDAGESARYLDEVIGNLDRLADERVPDLDLLRIALGSRRGKRADPAGRLASWAEAGAVPILRWGVPLALQLVAPLADREPFARWRQALAEVARTLSPISTWTAWTPAAAAG